MVETNLALLVLETTHHPTLVHLDTVEIISHQALAPAPAQVETTTTTTVHPTPAHQATEETTSPQDMVVITPLLATRTPLPPDMEATPADPNTVAHNKVEAHSMEAAKHPTADQEAMVTHRPTPVHQDMEAMASHQASAVDLVDLVASAATTTTLAAMVVVTTTLAAMAVTKAVMAMIVLAWTVNQLASINTLDQRRDPHMVMVSVLPFNMMLAATPDHTTLQPTAGTAHPTVAASMVAARAAVTEAVVDMAAATPTPTAAAHLDSRQNAS